MISYDAILPSSPYPQHLQTDKQVLCIPYKILGLYSVLLTSSN